ncbi:Acyl-CoA synthetase member 2 mitochondrial [Dimargaris xerosporica]|nr:Acyl-CoA synthetase member 2 mitochondrial [Dimargaris xerosporica]
MDIDKWFEGCGQFFQPGDIAKFDADGFCHLVGRKKDMIIKGGENIYPEEIEKCLISHPNIQAVAVIGIQRDAIEEEV